MQIKSFIEKYTVRCFTIATKFKKISLKPLKAHGLVSEAIKKFKRN